VLEIGMGIPIFLLQRLGGRGKLCSGTKGPKKEGDGGSSYEIQKRVAFTDTERGMNAELPRLFLCIEKTGSNRGGTMEEKGGL